MTQLVTFVDAIFRFYEFLIFLWCILSWLPRPQEGILYDATQAIDRLVRPYVGIFRRFIPPIGGFDFSPWISLIALDLVERVVIQVLVRLVLVF